MSTFKQAAHPLLVIPGPIEVVDSVLLANASPSVSHTSPGFAKIFQNSLRMLRKLLYTKDGQPFLVAGAGTLGWDMVASNLVEPGEHALVVNSGYFGDAFADCLEVYGAKVSQVKAPVGDRPTLKQIEEALSKQKFKVLTFTHVDTSTGVLADAKGIAELVKRVSPDTLVILDGVCSLASEEIRFDEWGIDVVIAASQKGLGCPPGLSVTCASQKALKVLETRKTPVTSYFASWKRWLPIHQAYDKGLPAYFSTPCVQLITALEESLKIITEGSVSIEDRFRLHRENSRRVKKAVSAAGLHMVPVDIEAAANGMTAVYAPEGLKALDIVPKMGARQVTVAAGLHKDIKERYFRIGHMGATVVDESRGDIAKVIKALQESLDECGYKKGSE